MFPFALFGNVLAGALFPARSDRDLTTAIVGGVLSPDEQLPTPLTRAQLMSDPWPQAEVIVHRAVRKADGFVYCNVKYPHQLSRCPSPSDDDWSEEQYWFFTDAGAARRGLERIRHELPYQLHASEFRPLGSRKYGLSSDPWNDNPYDEQK